MTPDDQEKMRAEDEAYRRFGGNPAMERRGVFRVGGIPEAHPVDPVLEPREFTISQGVVDPPIDPQAYLNQRRAEAAAAAESGRWSVGPPSLDDAIARLMTAVHQMQVAANLVQDIMSAPVAQVVRPPRAVISIAPTPDMGRGRLILGNSAPSAGLPDRRLTVAVQLLPFDGPLVDGSPAGVAQGAVLHAGGAR